MHEMQSILSNDYGVSLSVMRKLDVMCSVFGGHSVQPVRNYFDLITYSFFDPCIPSTHFLASG